RPRGRGGDRPGHRRPAPADLPFPLQAQAEPEQGRGDAAPCDRRPARARPLQPPRAGGGDGAAVSRGPVALLALLLVAGAGAAAGAQARPEVRRVVMLGLSRPEKSLASFVQSVSEPGSSAYGRYLTLAQLRQRFGAKPAVRRPVLGFLRRAPG